MVYGLTGLRPTVLELWVDNGHVTLVVHLGVCCAGVWVACTPRTCTIRTIHAIPGPRRSMGISDRHIPVPYLWIRPISSWVRFGVKNQKKVDNAVVFGLRGMHNHTHYPFGPCYGLCRYWGRFSMVWGVFWGSRTPRGGSANPLFHIGTIPVRGLNKKSQSH